MFEYARDPRVGPTAGWPVHTSKEETLRYIQSSHPPFDFAFEEKSTGKMIGTGGLCDRHYDWLPGKDDEIGYVLHPAYWGRGLAPEAMRAVIQYAFQDLGLAHLWCGYFTGNEQSRRVQEKLGFVPFGEPREQDVPALHTRRLEQFSLLTKEDWARGCQGGRYTK